MEDFFSKMTSRPSDLHPTDFDAPFSSNRRIFFGHQSVGTNILNGIRLLSPAARIMGINSDNPDFRAYGIFHAQIGRNHHAYSKIDDFARFIRKYGSVFDIAMMKLCYVDINMETDLQSLFDYYRSMVEKLAKTAPKVCMVHMTVPIRSIRLGLRSRLKLWVGQPLHRV
jgi:hypothetical protein